MTKLTDAQLLVLSRAAQREDGAAVLPERLQKSAATKIAASLVQRKLMREMRAREGMPVWRTGEDDRPMSLVIMRAGRTAVSLGQDAPSAYPPVSRQHQACSPDQDQPQNDPPRSGTKLALVVSLLSRDSGASLEQLIEATGWLPHTTRAALTGLRRRGFSLVRISEPDHPTNWRIEPAPMAGQAPASSPSAARAQA